jgi:glutathione S-transferase
MNDTNDRYYLYSFRRCPYAMRARMALFYSGIQVDIEEVDFKNKPARLLEMSPKGTVPVLCLHDGSVIDESLDIINWALNENDPEGWLDTDAAETQRLIQKNDGTFKKALDRYKYPNRYPDEDCSNARATGQKFLEDLNHRLTENSWLMGVRKTKADIAIFPFIRQFANTDREWFDALPLKALQNWLQKNLDSDLFQTIMKKDLTHLN